MADKINDVAVREIRAEMARQGLSQAELADRLGWSVFQVGRRMRGQIALTLADLDAIAVALNVPMAQFMEPRSRFQAV